MEQVEKNNNAIEEDKLNGDDSNSGNDYSHYLVEDEISFSFVAPYLFSGNAVDGDTWLIHISVVLQQFDGFIKNLLKYLKSEKHSFVIPANANAHSGLLDGRSGLALLGKIITICLVQNDKVEQVVKIICSLTAGLFGPSIPCAYKLTDVIALEYGPLFGHSLFTNEKGSLLYGSGVGDALRQRLSASHIKWPLQTNKSLKGERPLRFLKKQYIPVETFKIEPKGNVFKALKINAIFNMQWCVLKQGRRYQSFDDSARDMRDRLKWQFAIHVHFQKSNILPKPLEYFELKGDGFFAMEYMESISLAEKTVQLSEGHTWRSMQTETKRQLIGYLLQVVRIISLFHEEGFIHRDITPANFIVTETGQVSAIDVELCYDTRKNAPNPPFNLGTPGYMSPDQQRGSTPDVKDDIYSFGALLIALFTGILPNKLNHNGRWLITNLDWFIDSVSLNSVIVACVDSDPALRPSLAEIKTALEVYDTVLLTSVKNKDKRLPVAFTNTSAIVLADSVSTLCKVMASRSSDIPGRNLPTNRELLDSSRYSSLPNQTIPIYAELIILCLLLKFNKSASISVRLLRTVDDLLKNSGQFTLRAYERRILVSALRECKAEAAQILTSIYAVPDECNQVPQSKAGISGGLAGCGLKLIYLMEQNLNLQDQEDLAKIVNSLLAIQLADGSWLTRQIQPDMQGQKITGFAHGIAGIIFFLLSYITVAQSDDLKTKIILALNWLINQRQLDGGKLTWHVSTESQVVDPWFEHGFSGVALTFIKAYEVLGDLKYKEIASEVLAYHPVQITSNYCSFANGLAGLGEIYLEAFSVFKEQEWYQRALAVNDVLVNSCYRDQDTCYWLDGTQLEPIPDFETGNAGVIHFLLRFKHADQIPFPYHLIQ